MNGHARIIIAPMRMQKMAATGATKNAPTPYEKGEQVVVGQSAFCGLSERGVWSEGSILYRSLSVGGCYLLDVIYVFNLIKLPNDALLFLQY